MESHTKEEYLDTIIHDLEIIKSNLDMNKIEELAKDLIKYDKVAAFGLLYSESAAMDFQTKLAYNGKYIISHMHDIKQDDLLRMLKRIL